MSNFLEFAPTIIVILGFLTAYRIFVTPVQMREALTDFEHSMEKKFVLKETHNLAISEMKSDIEEIKDKLDKIYDMLIKG